MAIEVIRPRAILFWLILLFAGAGSAAAQGPVVQVVQLGAAPYIDIGLHMGLYFDPTGRVDIAEVAAAPERFVRSASRAPGLGYHTGRVWVRFVLHNDSVSRQERWLRLYWPFQESVRLHLLDAEGRGPRMDSGARVPVAERPLPSRHIVFPISLEPGETRTGYMAIEGRAATVVGLKLWEPASYADALQSLAAAKYLALGSTFIAVVFCMIAWRVRGQPALLLGALGSLLLLLVIFLLDGYAAEALAGGDSMWQNRAIQCVTFLALGCHVLFAHSFLHIPRHRPRLARGVLAAGVLAFAMAAVPLFTIVPSLATYGSTACAVLLTAVALVCMNDDGKASQTYVASWGLLWAFGLLRNAQQLGWVPELPFLVELGAVGLVLASSTLSMALYLSVRTVRDRAESAQRALIEQQGSEQSRLRDAVEATTVELRQAMLDAEQAGLAKSAFVSMMSHELRAPLHTVLGYARLLQRDITGEQRQWADAIERSGGALLRLFDQVLTFSSGLSGRQHPDLAPVDVVNALSRLVEDCRLLALRQHNRLSLEVQPGLPALVMVDEQWLMQALRNLVENACKYTRAADIVIEVTRRSTGSAGSEAQRLRLAVTDTGPGIPADQHEVIFEPFGRLVRDRHRHGVGLGLAIARQLVRAMGGELKLQSNPGHGCRFSFDIPLIAVLGSAAERPPAVSQPSGYLGARRRLLVVDDTPENLRFVADLCASWGFEVTAAASGAEALIAVDAPGARFDAALLDQYMPAMNGWELLQALHARPWVADLPVFLLSAAEPERPAGLDPAIGFDALLRKPFSSNELAEVLGTSLGIEWQREAVSAAVSDTESDAGCAAPRGPAPPDEVLDRLAGMIELGQVVALERSLAGFEVEHPESAFFFATLRQCCIRLDLRGLQQAIEAAQAQRTT